MPDCMSAYLELGGTVPENRLAELAEKLSRQGGPEWGEYYAGHRFQVEADLRTASSQVRPFVIYDDEAPWGQFEELESLCQEIDLTYRRHRCAKYEYDAVWQWWRPAMDEPAYCLASQEGAVLVEADAFRQRWRAASAQALRHTALDVAIELLVANMEEWLANHIPPEIPPLEIIKD